MVSEEEMVRVGQSLIDKMVNYSPELVCEANVVKEVVFVKIRNSKGGEASYRKSIFGIGLEGLLVRGTDMLFVGESESSCHPLLDTTNIAETVIEQLERAKEIVSPPVGHLPVIFTPNGVASALISSLALAFNGKTALQGASPLGNRKGEKVFDEKFSFWDDATLNFRPGSRICDAEGIPSQKTSLVENGTVMNFLYDLQTAGLANTRSTGNASRSLTSQPTPQISSLVIKEGKTSFSEMVQDIKEGLVVEYVMGATQGNVLGGEFSGNVLLGYKIENGKIVGRVKNTMVSGNVYEILKEIVAIGSESKWVGSLKTPPIYCPRLAVVAEG
jgi:PmbA protein